MVSTQITFKERHDFFKKKDYLFFLFFLLVVAEKSNSFLMTVFINSIYALLYFLVIWLIDKKMVILNEKMVSKAGRRLPMKMIQQLLHNGRYLYLKFEKNQYMKIYDPQKKLTNLILSNQQSLKLSEENIQHLIRRAKK